MAPTKIQEYFIGHFLRATDDVFEHARAVVVLRFSIVFAFIFIAPVAADFIYDYDKLVIFHLFVLFMIILFPLILRWSKNLDFPLILLFSITVFSSLVVFIMVSPMRLEMVGMGWVFFFTVLNVILQRGRMRILFAVLIWLPVVYVILNIASGGKLTIHAVLEHAALDPPPFLVFVPAAMTLYAAWMHTITIDSARKTIQLQKSVIEDKNKDITDSITYARHLQEALLPPIEEIRKEFSTVEVYYRPKDIVAGDFYWMEKSGDRVYIAVADCTGHGVPGAMVSVICSGALTRCVKELGLKEPGEILDRTRELVIDAFSRSMGTVNDGMDISLLCYDRSTKIVTWSGANNSLWYHDGEMKILKADKQPVGYSVGNRNFTSYTVSASSATTFYLVTDGYADQFGGPDGKKFKAQNLMKLLGQNSHLKLAERMREVDRTFLEWKGNLEQVDDVCIIAVQI